MDQLFQEFKNDFYPGEEVTVSIDGGDRVHGLVRDKTSFGPRVLPDGTKLPPQSRYLVLLKEDQREIHVKDVDVSRDRGVFTKAMLRSFIKRTTTRESWTGAPWLVKHDYAETYHIDTRVPPHLRQDSKREERKLLQAQRRASQAHGTNGARPAGELGPMRLPELKPAPKDKKGKHNVALHGGNPSLQAQKIESKEPTPPPPPPKYPIEDLELQPQASLPCRPQLRFLCRDPPYKGHADDWMSKDIDMQSVGPLLETWDTLNVYCEIFQLDSFTFDDFVEAMLVASEMVPVQLFDEIHCAVLKVLVDWEREGGKVQISLPEVEGEDSDEEEDEDEDEDDEEGSDEETPEPEPKPTGRATRSSLAKLEAERLAAEAAAAEEEAELETRHRAEELLKDYSWIEHLRNRDFADGGWERIMVGLLHQLSKNPRKEAECEELLLQLVPPDVEPTQETVRQLYAELDVNYRVKALQIICMLTMETKTVRGYMEECSETMTKYRKDKIEWQRQRKQLYARPITDPTNLMKRLLTDCCSTEELRQLNEQRKILLPQNMPPAPEEETVKKEEDVKMTNGNSTPADDEADNQESDEDSKSRKKPRRATIEKQQQRREEEKERKEKEKAKKEAAKLPTQSKEFVKLLKDIQKKEDTLKNCEEEVAVIDNDLREADCPRTRVLGKDRFWNRYYWFERNGMPYGGLPTSSTAHADYANGCIWVQGPDDMEREGYLDLPKDLEDEYKAKFDMTIAERKVAEEGETRVDTAHQWGYISTPDQVDELIKWLDTRGNRESKLRKELLAFREKIVANMEHRNAYLGSSEEREEKKEDTKRTSSRIREKTPDPPNYRCLQWENTTALENQGHLHSELPPPPRPRKAPKKRERETVESPAPTAAIKKKKRRSQR